MSEYRKAGREFTKGVLEHLLFVAVLFIGISYGVNYFRPIDETDNAWYDRSGFKVVVDKKTGKEYLVHHDGAVFIR